MIEIKFSHRYHKMPHDCEKQLNILAAVVPIEPHQMCSEFIAYDTAYDGGMYPLPKGKLLMLCITTHMGEVRGWQTLRRWTLEKEKYYLAHLGEEIEIVIEEAK